MKTFKLLVAAMLTGAAGPSLPQTPAAPPSWLVAQISYCDLEGRKVPTETRYCREGRVWECSKSGTWINTNKPC